MVGGARPARLGEQYQDLAKQAHAARLGMWLFLVSEALLFGALFALYVGYRTHYPHVFRLAIRHDDRTLLSFGTFILLTSSLTSAWAVHSIRNGRYRQCITMLVSTGVLGAVFLILKFTEYSQHLREGIGPGQYYTFQGIPGSGARIFFTLYYLMTGLHAIHLGVGIILMAVMATLVYRRRYTQGYSGGLEAGVLYWHLIDLIWLFLWPMLYLMV